MTKRGVEWAGNGASGRDWQGWSPAQRGCTSKHVPRSLLTAAPSSHAPCGEHCKRSLASHTAWRRPISAAARDGGANEVTPRSSRASSRAASRPTCAREARVPSRAARRARTLSRGRSRRVGAARGHVERRLRAEEEHLDGPHAQGRARPMERRRVAAGRHLVGSGGRQRPRDPRLRVRRRLLGDGGRVCRRDARVGAAAYHTVE